MITNITPLSHDKALPGSYPIAARLQHKKPSLAAQGRGDGFFISFIQQLYTASRLSRISLKLSSAQAMDVSAAP
jgi:hypothetical protein